MQQIDSKVFVRHNKYKHAGVAQLVEHYLAKVDVVGSNPIARSNTAPIVKWHYTALVKPNSKFNSWWEHQLLLR